MTSSPNSGLASSLAASSLLSEPDSLRYLSQARAQRKPFVTFLIENDILDSKALADFCELEYGVPLLDLAAFDLQRRAMLVMRAARGQGEAADRSDRRQRFTAEAQRGHRFEIVEVGDLAGGVA